MYIRPIFLVNTDNIVFDLHTSRTSSIFPKARLISIWVRCANPSGVTSHKPCQNWQKYDTNWFATFKQAIRRNFLLSWWTFTIPDNIVCTMFEKGTTISFKKVLPLQVNNDKQLTSITFFPWELPSSFKSRFSTKTHKQLTLGSPWAASNPADTITNSGQN